MSAADYDVVVIGGGIHGVGVAQAAAAAGYSVLLLERTALASGTSSRSSKLIHGGLRYLESARFGLVRESLREREILLRIAPALVHRIPFHIPVYGNSRRPPWMIRAGLSLYALLGGLSRHARFDTLPRARWDSLDGLDTRGLKAVFRYEDAQTDDTLLTQAVMRSAQKFGAELRCPANFLSARRRGDDFVVHILEGKDEHTCRARTLVNAAGPWAGTVLERITPRPAVLPVDLVQGAHIIVENETRHGIYYLEAPQDGRAVFIMPWQEHTLVGTTETPFDGDPAAVTRAAGGSRVFTGNAVALFPRPPRQVARQLCRPARVAARLRSGVSSLARNHPASGQSRSRATHYRLRRETHGLPRHRGQGNAPAEKIPAGARVARRYIRNQSFTLSGAFVDLRPETSLFRLANRIDIASKLIGAKALFQRTRETACQPGIACRE